MSPLMVLVFVMVTLVLPGCTGIASVLTSDLVRLFHTGCVVLVNNGQLATSNKLKQTSRSLSQMAVTTKLIKLDKLNETSLMFKCQVNRPLYVLTGDDETRAYLQRMGKVSSYPRWLLFLDESIDAFLADVNVPFDCEFFVAESRASQFILTEVYRVAEGQTLISVQYGTWQPEHEANDKTLPLISSTNDPESRDVNRSESRLQVDERYLYERRNSLQGLQLRTSGIHNPSLTIFRRDGNQQTFVDGYFGQVYNLLEQRINFTSNLTELHSIPYGSLTLNGSWDGMIAMIRREEIDISVNDFTMNEDRRQAVDFVAPLIRGRVRLYIRKPDTLSLQWNSFLMPFTSTLWYGILGSILLLSVAMTIATCLLPHQQGSGTRAADILWRMTEALLHVFGQFCQQGPDEFPSSASSRGVSLLAGVTSIVFLAAYSGSLTSFIAVQRTEMPFTTIQGFMDDGSYKLGLPYNAIPIYFNEPRSKVFDELLTKSILPHIGSVPNTTIKGMEQICVMKKLAWLTAMTFSYDFFSNLPCEVVALPEYLMTDTQSFVMKTNSPYLGILNYNLHHMRDNGVLNHIYRLVYREPLINAVQEFPFVTFSQAVPIISILIFGYIFSFIVLAFEHFN